MTDSAWIEDVKAKLGAALLNVRESAPGEWEFTTDVARMNDVLAYLRGPGQNFTHLSDLTAYDDHPRTPRFYVVYELLSMSRHQRCAVLVVAETSSGEPRVPTVTPLWAGANWLEREVFDMLGIYFTGHPDLRRILLPPDFKGYPLRKDFIVDYRQQFPQTEAPSNPNELFSTLVSTKVTGAQK